MANSPGKGGAYPMVWLFSPSSASRAMARARPRVPRPNYPVATVSGMPGKWDVWVDGRRATRR